MAGTTGLEPAASGRDRQADAADYGQRGWLPTGGAEFGALHRRELRGLAPLALPRHCVSVEPSQLLGPRVENRF
jgi:hypothetical protein